MNTRSDLSLVSLFAGTWSRTLRASWQWIEGIGRESELVQMCNLEIYPLELVEDVSKIQK